MTSPETTALEIAYRKSYRYVRWALVAFLGAIFTSIAWEWGTTWYQGHGCLRTSISAYYYTPVQAVFTGSLIAVGACLIALRAYPDLEDIFLNLAGAMAILVALVPTPLGPSGAPCSSVRGGQGAQLLDTSHLRDTVQNNTLAFLIVGFVVAAAIGVLGRATVFARRSSTLGWLGCVVLLLGGVWWWISLHRTPSDVPTSCDGQHSVCLDTYLKIGHFTGAGLLFVCIGLVVLVNRKRVSVAGKPLINSVPVWIFLAMVVGAVVLLGLGVANTVAESSGGKGFWDHWLLALEATQLALFAWFWIWQTVQPTPSDPLVTSPPSIDIPDEAADIPQP